MIGIDIVENLRIKNKDEKFVKRVLSTEELEYYNILKEERKITFLAGRFACKEAIFKASKVGNKDLNYSDITIKNDVNNAPYVTIMKYPLLKFEISISHEKNYTTAIALKLN